MQLSDPTLSVLRSQLDAFAARLESLEAEKAKKEAEARFLNSTMEEFRVDIKDTRSALTGVFEHMHVLETVALEVSLVTPLISFMLTHTFVS